MISSDDVEKVLDEIDKASFDIPFENSQFQTDNFVVNSQHTPARAYRAILLRLSARIRALKEAKYNLAKEDIDIEEFEFNIKEEKEKETCNNYAIRRWELEIAQKKESRTFTLKLINDAVVEVTHLYELFQRFPKYTRAQFEEQEREHFAIRLSKQAIGIQGALESLDNMGIKEVAKLQELQVFPTVFQQLEKLQLDHKEGL